LRADKYFYKLHVVAKHLFLTNLNQTIQTYMYIDNEQINKIVVL